MKSGTIDFHCSVRQLAVMNWDVSKMTPEEHVRLVGATLSLGGFYCIIVERLLKEPPPKTEPYTPNNDIPPSPYIPLAHR